jgi:hypothetical protein
VSAYDLGRFAESARFVRHHPEARHSRLARLRGTERINRSRYVRDQVRLGICPNRLIVDTLASPDA